MANPASTAVIFDFLKINKNFFYHAIVLYPCKEESFSFFIIVKFEIYSTLKNKIRWDFRINVLLIPLKYNKQTNKKKSRVIILSGENSKTLTKLLSNYPFFLKIKAYNENKNAD